MNNTRSLHQTLLNLYYCRRCEESDRLHLRDRLLLKERMDRYNAPLTEKDDWELKKMMYGVGRRSAFTPAVRSPQLPVLRRLAG